MAAAIELGLKPGRISGAAGLHQPAAKLSSGMLCNCTYCGLARDVRSAEDNSFIRVGWPLYPTDLVAEKIGELERKKEVGRVCVAQVRITVQTGPGRMISRVRLEAPDVPISALVTATLLNDEWLMQIKDAGADIIGVGFGCGFRGTFLQYPR
ncbi:MAG: hypothetical protein CM1200mP30_32600 [Pseudomonadota bacterium]|nr:MAG: hypothetical protein CM1200mP30_32600 [Pseudomonadota bacterium]